MARRRGRHGRTAVAAVPLLACLMAAGPSLADEPPGATTTTVVPANETKIVLMEPEAVPTPPAPAPAPAPASGPARGPSPAPAAARPAPTAPAIPNVVPAAVKADVTAIRAAAEASAAEKRRLRDEIAALETGISAMEAVLATAETELSTLQARSEAAEARTAAAQSDLDRADEQVGRLEISARSASEAAGGQRTLVARPATRGRTPQDDAVQARRALAEALERRDALAAEVAPLVQERDLARLATAEASTRAGLAFAELQGGREKLADLRQQLAAAEEGPGATAGRPSGNRAALVPAPSDLAARAIPADYLSLYGRAATTCPGLPWRVLAAVGSVESGHGQSTAPGVRSGANFAGAMGPMQFLAGTWAAYGVDGDGDGVRDVYNPADAVPGAANYLCASGGGKVTTLWQALWAYNHADWYVKAVLDLAARY